MRRAGADFHVVGLQQRAALAIPVLLQAQDHLLEGEHRRFGGFGRLGSRNLTLGCARTVSRDAGPTAAADRCACPIPSPGPPPHARGGSRDQ